MGAQDTIEHRRLDQQHRVYTIALGGLFPAVPLVRWALRPRRNVTPAILDVGTGSGIWSVCQIPRSLVSDGRTIFLGSSIWHGNFLTAKYLGLT